MEAGHSVERGYRGAEIGQDIPGHCGSCHGDPERMQTYLLDPEVLPDWRSSHHGQLFEEGDPRAPDCTSCHGSHGILSHRNPDSPTHRNRIHITCGSCHSDPEKMAPFQLPISQEEDYMTGVHGRVLTGELEGDPDLAPTCVDCHGFHEARPPDALSVPEVCGTCHFDQSKYLRNGPHYPALRNTGSPSCITCHGNHDVTLPDNGLIREGCSECHQGEDDPGLQVAKQLGDLLDRTNSAVARIARKVEEGGFPSKIEHRLLHGERDRVLRLQSQIRLDAHSLDVAGASTTVHRLENAVMAAIAVAQNGSEGEDGFSNSVVALILGSIVLVLLLLSALAALLLTRLGRRLARSQTNREAI
jgi:hypothetical protein